jgi:hypothetical protein
MVSRKNLPADDVSGFVTWTANSRLVRDCCSLFRAASTWRETSKLLIEIEDYTAVSLFQDFRDWVASNLNPDFDGSCPNSNYASPKTAKRRNGGQFHP